MKIKNQLNKNNLVMDNDYLTVEEVASILRVKDLAIYRWLEEGNLRGIKISPKIWRIKKSEFENFLNRQESRWCYEYGMKLISIGGPENIKKGINELERSVALYPENKESVLSLSIELGTQKMLQDEQTFFLGELKYTFIKEMNILAHSAKQLFDDLHNAAKSLCKILGKRDGYHHDHFEQRAKYTREIAEKLGFERFRINLIEVSSFIYDIGKIYISNDILLKPGKLTEKEMELIKEHPANGKRLLDSIGLPNEVLWAVEHHHESLDGSGYPYGLSGEDIPTEAHIIKLVDTYGAMTTERPYRKPLSQQQAITEIRKSSGTHFNPRIIDTFLSVINK